MNEQLLSAKRRAEEIKRLKEYIKQVKERIKKLYESVQDMKMSDSIRTCSEALEYDICFKHFDLQNFYSVLENENSISSEYKIQLIDAAEDVLCYQLEIIKLESKERLHLAKMNFISEMGFQTGERYIISFPEDDNKQNEEWVVTEFRVGVGGSIYPVHGCKMKKDGEPYKVAQYISTGNEFVITKK